MSSTPRPVTGADVPRQRHEPGPDALARLVDGLEELAAQPPEVWRGELRARLAQVRTLLAEESPGPDDWLQARRSTVLRERNALLDRVTATRRQVLVDDVDRAAYEVRRLAACVRRHLQRVNDVVWDEVEFEVGGSE